MTRARLSVVVPVYYNAENLPESVPELLALRETLPEVDLELVFVDDGSGDDSLQILQSWQAREPETIHLVRLSRNFGSMNAVLAGFAAATGDCVGVIAADLQDPPALLADMLAHWRAGAKAVLAARTDREEGWLQSSLANSYYWLLGRLALPGYPAGGFDFVLVDRQLRDDLVRIREKNTNFMSLIFWLGYSPVLVPYVRRARRRGVSRWTFGKKLKLFVDSFVAFSTAPLKLCWITGSLVMAMALAIGGRFGARWMLSDVRTEPSLWFAVALLFASGVQLLMLGVLGEYIWRALEESRGRPPYIVAQEWPSRRASAASQ